MATIKTVVVDAPDTASVFTNGVQQEEMGPYRVPVAFKDEQNNTDFTELRASPVKVCWSELNIETACSNSPPTNVFLQQVDYQCTLELLSSSNALPIDKFMEAVPYFDSSTGLSYCELRSTCNASSLQLLSTKDSLELNLKVKARDFEGTYEVSSKTQTIPFLPAFSVDMYEVLLSPSEHTVLLKIAGVPKVLQNIQVRVLTCNWCLYNVAVIYMELMSL